MNKIVRILKQVETRLDAKISNYTDNLSGSDIELEDRNADSSGHVTDLSTVDEDVDNSRD